MLPEALQKRGSEGNSGTASESKKEGDVVDAEFEVVDDDKKKK